ncbi:hypothetical protein EVAR_88042_1 [Eumeta japonica]|uniref:Uncharacterized protein n=1 Tax=Eumeta variegata TaxID=151549 RepID=A0A4C1VDU1_EUMVA|nr:hypothetical protein EVAR_88042_1 [Eumeta japonica]
MQFPEISTELQTDRAINSKATLQCHAHKCLAEYVVTGQVSGMQTARRGVRSTLGIGDRWVVELDVVSRECAGATNDR